MDDETKKSALEKVDTMIPHVAYPHQLLNDTEVDAYYQNIELTGGNYLKYTLNLNLFLTLKKYSSLRLPVDKDDWTFYGDVAVVNAFYGHLYNVISNYILIENSFCCTMFNKIQCSIFNVSTTVFVQYFPLVYFKVFYSATIDQGT